jgi:APA family basic amino acid/polyamine antiporter
MSRDGLLPTSFFGAVHERFRTPWKSTIVTGILVAAMAAFLPINILLFLVNMGTLLAFAIVCAAVLIMAAHRSQKTIQSGKALGMEKPN